MEGIVMNVADLMTKNYLSINPDTPICKIQQLLVRHHLNGLVVTENKDELIGIVTYSDICSKLLPDYDELMQDHSFFFNPEKMEDRLVNIMNLPVKEIMTTKIITTSPDNNAIKAGALMNAKRIKLLPVVENDKLVGIISRTDIAWGLIIKYCKYIPK